MACGESNGRVTDDVTRPQKFKFVTPISIEPNILKTAGNAIKQQSLITIWIVCCEAVQSAILATHWLRVNLETRMKEIQEISIPVY